MEDVRWVRMTLHDYICRRSSRQNAELDGLHDDSFSLLYSSGSELPDTRRADGSEQGSFPSQWPMRIRVETRFPVSAEFQLQPREHRRRPWTHSDSTYYTGQQRLNSINTNRSIIPEACEYTE